MEVRPVSCDTCLGSAFEPYVPAARGGRDLDRCCGCGLVVARSASRDAAPVRLRDRDPRDDARRATAVGRLLSAGRVLEIGAGGGQFLLRLDPARYSVLGLEPDAEAAQEAAATLSRAGARGTVLPAWLPEAHLEPESFDLVAVFGALARCASPRSTMMEICRLLRPGGQAVIETPCLASLTARLKGSRWGPLNDPTVEYFYTRESLGRLTTTCGFQPGSTWMAMPVGWPPPGTLVLVTRKAASCLKSEVPSPLGAVGTARPLGATH